MVFEAEGRTKKNRKLVLANNLARIILPSLRLKEPALWQRLIRSFAVYHTQLRVRATSDVKFSIYPPPLFDPLSLYTSSNFRSRLAPHPRYPDTSILMGADIGAADEN